MSTLTSRLKLLKPDRLELVNVLTQLNANLDRLDAGGNGAYVCTSTSRPNGNNYPVFEGQLIYETDTSLLMVRRGTVWEPAGSTPATWRNLDLPTTPAGYSGGTGSWLPAAMRMGKLGYVKGQILKNTGIAAGEVIASIPDQYMAEVSPAVSVRLECATNANRVPVEVTLQGDGKIVNIYAISGAIHIFLAHSYPLGNM